MSQSLPNQVNDFNDVKFVLSNPPENCRNPFQTRSTTSILEADGSLVEIDPGRNPFQTRSTTSMGGGQQDSPMHHLVAIPSKPGQRLQWRGRSTRRPHAPSCRNPFQTRSTTSIGGVPSPAEENDEVSQSLPNQVNDFNYIMSLNTGLNGHCRNPFQTRSTTSIFMMNYNNDYKLLKSQSLPNQVNDFNSR